MTMWRGAVLVFLALISAGCGYHLVGTSSFLPPDLKTLHVQPFENTTDWADMDQRLTEAVVQEWVRRRRFSIVDDEKGADLSLRGTIKSLSVSPVTLDEQGRATEYQMTLTASVSLVDIRGEEPKVLWEDKAFSRRTSYQVDVSAVNYFDRQIEAMSVVSAEFARALVTAVLEGF
jgi:outer membrane lipopolysaccharide assembly protein LptE/RlpB